MQKNRHLCTIAQLCRAVSSGLRHVSTIGKNLLNSNASSNMVNFGPLTAGICWRVRDTPANFNGFRVLAASLHGSLVLDVGQTLRRWTEGSRHHLYLAVRPSRWAMGHVSSLVYYSQNLVAMATSLRPLQSEMSSFDWPTPKTITKILSKVELLFVKWLIVKTINFSEID